MKYASVNPYNNELIKEFPLHPFPDISSSQAAFDRWRKLSVDERCRQMKKVAVLLEKNIKLYAELITLEMGKPLREAEYELNKTLTAFDYYLEHAPVFLQNQTVLTAASKSYVSFEPLGIIFSIMPWNFPFWQVFRFAVPTLISGNVTILKHAPSVPQCALAIQVLFDNAGVERDIFKNYFLSNEDAGKLIAHPAVAGISFTGSDITGSILAEQAGKHIKKCVMELGGNDAFIVLDDADMDLAIAGAIKSRSINSGQACNGAKRFIVTEKIANSFTTRLITEVQQLTVGHPMDAATQIGPLARKDLKQKAEKQIAESVKQGAIAHYGNDTPNTGGNFVRPVVLENVKPGVTSFEEEVFAPVWSVITVKDAEEALRTANHSAFGLGASIWTNNQAEAEKMVSELQTGNVFINDIVKSNPMLPFGGIKRSGFGRELSEYGLKEFVNIKTVYIN